MVPSGRAAPPGHDPRRDYLSLRIPGRQQGTFSTG